jgi:2-polyprenyl-3-methyl-5-hydroxy-6-metoxy-1,4-benzoquinol methylase
MSSWRRTASAVRWRLAESLAHLPVLAAKEQLYRDVYFREMDALHTPVYERLADAVYGRLHPASVIDVGCGTGRLLAAFADKGVSVRGLEGSRHAIAISSVSEHIIRCNLERGVPDIGRFDACFCIEVAEHLPPRCAKSLVSGITAMSDVVVFTAAPPGQKGSHHINLRPQAYWINAFEEQGFLLNSLTEDLRISIARVQSDAKYIEANLMVFTSRMRADLGEKSAEP